MLRSQRGDGYARLTASGTEVLALPDEGGVLFVDLAFRTGGWDLASAALRSFPPSVLAESSRVIVRSPFVRWAGPIEGLDPNDSARLIVSPGPEWPQTPEDMASSLEGLLKTHRLPRRSLAVFELPVGAAPVVSPGLSSEDLARCRSVELEAFLRRTGAIWEPTAYHYQLPSGHHASSFVRVADALNDPRAPGALATWLHGSLSEGSVVVVDSGTLMPLVQQLDLVLKRAATTLPVSAGGLLAVEALDRYPLTRFEYLRRFKPLEATDVLAILSVSSTGRTYRLLRQSLQDTAEGAWRSECLVKRGPGEAEALPGPDVMGAQDPWLSITGLAPPSDPGRTCEMCRDGKRARVIHIDPRTFGAMALPTPVVLMPGTFAARRNASLFEAYQGVAALGPSVQLSGTETSRLRAKPYHRPHDPRRIRFEPVSHLLDKDSLKSRIEGRINELVNLRDSDPSKKRIIQALEKIRSGEPTVAVCDSEELRVLSKALELAPGSGLNEEEAAKQARTRFLAASRAVCPTVARLVGDKDPDFTDAFQGEASILLFVAGLQTGVTLQHLVVSLQDVFRAQGTDPAMHGLVLHAHPHDSEAWASVRNSFGGRRDPSLLALWLTYLPADSPFAEERDLLAVAQDEWFSGSREGTRALWRSRLSWLRFDEPETTSSESPDSPLWSPVPMKLRRTSIYGLLDDRHAVVAVGAALSEALDGKMMEGAPEWVHVDLPNAFRSYFDGLLHVSLLRWVSPQRAWWGGPNDCSSLINELHGRFADSDDWPLLLAELLLAAALGKLPDDGVELLLSLADIELREAAHPEPILEFIDLGRVFVENLWHRAAVAETSDTAA